MDGRNTPGTSRPTTREKSTKGPATSKTNKQERVGTYQSCRRLGQLSRLGHLVSDTEGPSRGKDHYRRDEGVFSGTKETGTGVRG